jgi:hypothetical protein
METNIDWRTVEGEIFGMGQRAFLVSVAKAVSDAFSNLTIVNIGVRRGASLHCIRAGAPDATLIGIDIQPCNPIGKGGLDAVYIHGDSNAVHEQVEPPIHLVLVDGGHGYDTVKGDIEGWVPKIPVSGIVALHDMHMGGVIKAFDEWWGLEANNWEEMPGSPGPGFRAFRRIR